MKGIIAAGSPRTAEAGQQILAAGGNAFDAAVGAALVSCAAEPAMTGAAGGGFLNAFTADGQATLFDFFVQTPRRKRPTEEIDFGPIIIDFGDTKQTFHVGLGAAATPSNLFGFFHVHSRLGRLPFKEVIAPAVAAARQGVQVTPFFRYCLDLVGPALTAHESGRNLILQKGRMPEVGEWFFNPELADTLELLAKEGLRALREGEPAQQTARFCREQGGHLTLEDFQHYQVIERRPLILPYRDYLVHTNPPPATGGSMIALTLALLAGTDLHQAGFGQAAHLRHLTNALHQVRIARRDHFDDHKYEADILDRFLDPAFVTHIQAEIAKYAGNIGCTTHLSVIDKDLNVAAVTTSLGQGCGYVVPGTGIMLNNMLGESDLNPKGFHQWPEDVRITSMMSPTILLRQGKPVMALGTGGANRIRSTVAQVISGVADFGFSPEEAILAPRLHFEPGNLDIEPGFAAEALAGITTPEPLKHTVFQSKHFYFGGVHSVYVSQDGTLGGFGDPRRHGEVRTA